MTAGSGLGVLTLVVIAASPNLPVFIVGWAFAGIAMAGVLYPPAFAAITGWFAARRLGALTTLTLVAGLASTVFAPLTAATYDQLGWRETYLWAAVLLAVLTVPVHWLVLRRPWPQPVHVTSKEPEAEKDYTSHVVRDTRFRLLTAGLTLVALAMYAALLALVPLMLERGLSPQTAAWVLGLGGLGQVAGRLVYTTLARHASLTVRTVTVFGLVTASTAVLAVVPGPVGLLVAASMTAGVGRGISTLLQATAVTDRWGARGYGRLSGVLGLPVLLATALAPGAGAVLAEVTGSYATGFAVLAAVAAVGTVLTVASTHGRATTAGRMRPLDMQVGEFRRQS